EREQLGAALGFQLAPERERLLGEPDPLRIVVGEPEDAARAVARAVLVSDRELFEHDHVATGALERSGGREADDARAHDHDLAPVRAHVARLCRSGDAQRDLSAETAWTATG